jgi:hypothetical protein
LGISLPAFVEAGVDMVNASDGYFTTNESDLALIRAMIPGTALYFETTQTTNLTALFSDGSRPFLRTTDQQFQTAADLAYRQGADGISVFNFAYYRQTIDENAADRGVGPFTEPPFHVLAGLRSPEYVASRPRWYVLAVDHNTYIAPSMQMPQTLHANESHTFELFLYPGVIGPEAILRVRVAPPTNYAGGEVPAWAAQVELNGTALDCIPFVEAPLADPYEANLAVDCSRFRCFKASSGIVREGQNLIKVTLVQPDPQSAANVALDYLDIAWP